MTEVTENRGFVITWQEPPLTSEKWTASVASNSPSLLHLMRANGAKVIEAPTRDQMIAEAKKYIDGLLG